MSKQHTQIFSISAKNTEEIASILNSVPNKSEFICQAIIEKSKSSEKAFRATVESVILEMILTGKINLNTSDIIAKTQNTSVETESSLQEFKADTIDDELLSVSKNW